MADKKKNEFKKGQSGNPRGRPKVPVELKRARRLTQIEFEKSVNKFLFGDKKHLNKVLNDPASTTFDLLIGQMIVMAIKQGDYQRLNFLMDRIIGKAKETVRVEVGEVPKWAKKVLDMSPGDLRGYIRKLKYGSEK